MRAFRALRSVVGLLGTVVCVSLVSFGLLYLLPGDPAIAMAGEGASTERVEQIRTELGLDDPFFVQYGRWLSGVARGDLGTSFGTGQPVSDRIAETLPTTLQLVGAALLFAVIFGLAAGLLAALRSGSKSETAVLTLTTVGIAVPNFWLGMMLVAFVAVKVEWLPTFGFVPISEGIRPYVLHLLLPALALSTVGIAEIARQSRSAMAEVLRSDHVRVARSKGLSPWQLLSRHVFKNAGIPILTVVGLLVNRLVGGTVVVESVFSITGSGSVVAHAAATRDVPMLQGLILALTIFVLLINLLVDTLYSKLDPRI